MATDALGNRSRKVNEILLDSEPTADALLVAVEQIPKLSLVFVENERLDNLADEMRAKIRSNQTAGT